MIFPYLTLKRFLLHEHAWPFWKLAGVGRRRRVVSVSFFWAGWEEHENQKQKWREGKRGC